MTQSPETKICTGCQSAFPATAEFFHRHKAGIREKCKKCRSQKKPSDLPVGMKRCNVCKDVKPKTLQFFNKHDEGLRPNCRVCRSIGPSVAYKHKTPACGHKFCSQCQEEKPSTVEFFMAYKTAKDGLRSFCRVCYAGYGAKNLNKKRAWSREWRKANPDRMRVFSQRAIAYRKITPARSLSHRVGQRMRAMLINNPGKKRRKSWTELVGYSVKSLTKHLESQFEPGMSWTNMGKWHIDHRVPLAFFNIETIDDPNFIVAWSLNNLSPMWSRENISKQDCYALIDGVRMDRPSWEDAGRPMPMGRAQQPLASNQVLECEQSAHPGSSP